MATLGEYVGAGSSITKGLYHMNGSSADSSGNSKNGTDTSMSYAAGKFGSAGVFSGSGYISLGTSDIGISGNVTISCRVNPTNLTGYQEIFNDWSATKRNLYIYSTNNDGILTTLSGNGSTSNDATFLTYNALSTGVYTHIVYTRSGANKALYINGSSVGTYAGTYSGGATTNDKTIGGESTGNKFTGQIDELIIENVVRDAAKVKNYYNYAKGRYATL